MKSFSFRAARTAACLASAWLLVLAAACSDDDDCNCPSSARYFTVVSPCDQRPVLTATGACTVGPSLTVNLAGAGACDLELTHDDGTTTSSTLAITSQAIACGSDPTGCGYMLGVTAPSGPVGLQLALGPQTCGSTPALDGGAD